MDGFSCTSLYSVEPREMRLCSTTISRAADMEARAGLTSKSLSLVPGKSHESASSPNKAGPVRMSPSVATASI